MKKYAKESIRDLLLFLLICIVIGNLLSGLYGFWIKGNLMDDFTLRYRESKYILSRINPFDIILGLQSPEASIGDLADVAGYTPWGMVYGIIFNLTFLPWKFARVIFFIIYVSIMLFTVWSVFKISRKNALDVKESIGVALSVLAIYGWSTGLSWLNVGALLGVAIFFSVLVVDVHPCFAGVLLGLAATKPQMALPFYLGFLIKKKYKTVVVAVIMPLIAWIISFILTSTSPFEMLIQFSKVMEVIGGQLGNWITSVGMFYEMNFANSEIQLVGMLVCIFVAIYAWYQMKKNNINDNLTFFSVAAILCGMWAYSQEHDKTVLIIVIVALAQKIKRISFTKDKRWYLYLFYVSYILDVSKVAKFASYVWASGSLPALALEFVRYIIWFWCVFFLANYQEEYQICINECNYQ